MFRTLPAQWFEELIARPMVAKAAEVLAQTGEVQFEFPATSEPQLETSALKALLLPFHQIKKSFGDYFCAPEAGVSSADEKLESAIERNVSRLISWKETIAPEVKALESLYVEQSMLEELASFLSLLPPDEIDFSDLCKAYPQLEFRLFVLPAESSTPPSAESILHLRVENENAVYLLTLGSLPDTKVTAEAMSGLNGKILPIPQWISGSTDNALLSLATRLREEQTQAERIQRHLSTTNETYRLGSLLGELNRLDWLVTHLEGVPVGEYFAHLTGWTSDLDGKRLQAALEAAKLPGAFSIKAHPGDLKAPSLIRNPGWIRPFEFFARLMGTPGTTEADPSPIIAVIAPILFGYMFGDVGHGLVLLTLGLYLRKRWPNLSMLFSGGIVSIVFGFLYGSLFTIETVLNPLWIRPFEDPLILLLMPLLFGATLILSGMALNGFAHLWEGRFTYWLGCEAGIMLAYCSLWLCWVYPQFWTLVVSGVIWHILGNLLWHRQSATDALAHSIGDLLEYLLQLLVNTISFVRVGAFTLAHAGLGISVYSLAESSGHWVWSLAILIAGNIGIIALEGLVVFVQTTRLLLFEFFIRFLKASGRPFLPMVPPTYSPRKEDL